MRLHHAFSHVVESAFGPIENAPQTVSQGCDLLPVSRVQLYLAVAYRLYGVLPCLAVIGKHCITISDEFGLVGVASGGHAFAVLLGELE